MIHLLQCPIVPISKDILIDNMFTISHGPKFRPVGAFLSGFSKTQSMTDPFYFMFYYLFLSMFLCININALICSYNIYVLKQHIEILYTIFLWLKGQLLTILDWIKPLTVFPIFD
jgi:hypothetical protein